MKMLTLNTHSLQEVPYEEKLAAFLQFILEERPDLIALQEVNQTVDAAPARDDCGMMRMDGCDIPLRADNHALRIVQYLRNRGIPVGWAWLPIKLGYGKYDEGLALMCLNGGISAVDACTISTADDYRNWRTRKVLGIQADNGPDWFYCVHMGWWQDQQEPFGRQWAMLAGHLRPKKARNRVWLMGDFNAPAHLRGQGYDLIAASGWQDAWLLAREKDDGISVRGSIDGWRELNSVNAGSGMRIDYIWCSEGADIKHCNVVLDGKRGKVVSDHFAVMVEV